MAKPLNELKGKRNWKWEEEYQRAFDELKDKITSQPVLALLKREDKFWVKTNVLEHAIGGVLSQKTRRKIETHHVFIQNNAISRKKLWDLQQRITCNCESSNKIETILVRCYSEI